MVLHEFIQSEYSPRFILFFLRKKSKILKILSLSLSTIIVIVVADKKVFKPDFIASIHHYILGWFTRRRLNEYYGFKNLSVLRNLEIYYTFFPPFILSLRLFIFYDRTDHAYFRFIFDLPIPFRFYKVCFIRACFH